MVNLRIGAEGLHFLVEFLKMENRILVLHYWVFLRQMIAIRKLFYIQCIQKTLVFTVVFACATS